jgi:hypothetical protein
MPQPRYAPSSGPGLAGARAGALLLILLVAAGCRGVEVMGTAGARGGTVVVGSGGSGPGGGSTSSALVGRWSRTIVLTTSDGTVHESRTEWEFAGDGTATRRVIAWNVTEGIGDTLVAVGQWRTSGSTLTIGWLSPTAGTVVFEWSVRGDQLAIGSDQYARVR